ncbi:substrate-binding domain-containing protein [Pigmentiphaga sp. GD03639]|uniref:Molybdate ABC transporter substrate-binding protein n=1 Tax=Pigmentiphaga daeguensis TaxID=414049 RepID=A0ABP3M1J3_9BURK|nr:MULTISPECIES: substrate-binding domain-containing protein [unclassified Pigmentiphaga]MDH2238420.1 substrate-binding domain-containing protein [Pigmentiphaga sp. GD03639]OVZ65437.1 molybdenum ABC transporter substrate-binding protein [Pigmentiphaga sp. NML030171]
MASQIHILSSMATKQLLADLVAQFQQSHAQQDILVESVGGVDAARRVQSGEALDAVVLAANVIDQMTEAGHIVAGSRVDLVVSGVYVAVRAGAPRPDIGSETALRQAVLDAGTIGYSTGPSGVYLSKLFERWGIADQIKDRTVQAKPGIPVGTLIAKGEVDLGFQQLSEMMNVPGIDIVGPLPPGLQVMTTFSAGVAATCTRQDTVRELLAFMASADAAEIKRKNGMDPA